MVTMFQDDEEVTGVLLMIKSTLVFLSVLNTVVNPWLYSQLNEPLKKTMRHCSDHGTRIRRRFIFRSCCQIQPERSSSGSEQKMGLQPYDQQDQPQMAKEQLERRNSRSHEPIAMPEEQQGTLRPPSNDLAIFTVSNRIVRADVTRSTSKNGKTRQTCLE